MKTKQFYLSQDEKNLGVPLELILVHCVVQRKLQVIGVYFMFHYIGTKTKQRVSMSKKSKVCTGRGSCAHFNPINLKYSIVRNTPLGVPSPRLP